MASDTSKTNTSQTRQTRSAVKKLAPIPKGSKIQKRPLLRQPLPASSKDRIIYVSSSTPFMSAVKRVRKQLDRSQRAGAAGAAHKNASLHARIEALKRDAGKDGEDGAIVRLMGTGKAVEKTVSLASWFAQQADCGVEVRTRTVATVDDVVGVEAAAEEEQEQEEDESRLRRLSCLEVAVWLK
ncbi:hypothetical protein K4F52_005123 [Lecanicillium sp. MT-2017a]|nr:hypothetical protein K4F52_005123 [Lecanicillium sp. MT-2017a]